MKSNSYAPPKVWKWDSENGGKFASINRPVSGATFEKTLPVGEHPLQLYSLATPNGIKVTLLLEELLALGIQEAEYDAWFVDILQGEQFSSGFVDINPNSKIPAMMDHSVSPPQRLFESGSIMLYLAEKFDRFIPKDAAGRAECMNWVFWQMGSTPFLGGGFGHFYAYAPEKFEYPINRFALETKRQLDVLDKQLAKHPYLAGQEYTLADMMVWPWYGALVLGQLYDAAEFLEVHQYTHLLRWARELEARPAVKRGAIINRTWGETYGQLRERHSAKDVDDGLNS